MIRAIRFLERADLIDSNAPGGFWISAHDAGGDAAMWFLCPCGCGDRHRILIGHCHKPQASGASWHWDGSETEPSLLPSIKIAAEGPCDGWHGWLRDGYWET